MKGTRREGSRPNRAGKMPSGLAVGVFLFLLIGLSAIQPRLAEAGLADHVVINEVSIAGASGAGGAYDDWVELYNPTDQAVSLSGWSLQKATAGGGIAASDKVIIGNKNIAAKGFFLVVRDSASTTQSLKDKANLLDGSLDLSTNNTVFLVSSESDVIGSSTPGIIDYVGWGTALYHEGTSFTSSFTNGRTIARIPAGEDTDQNSVDFQVQDPPTPTGSSATDDDMGGTVLLTITPDATPAQNINSTGAQIVFQVNAAGSAKIKYGLDTSYASSTAPQAAVALATTA